MDLTKYIEIPYIWRGRDLAGADCYGLIGIVYHDELGITLSDATAASMVPCDIALAVPPVIAADWTETTTPAAGDVVLLKMAGCPSHCGVWLDDDNRFLHTLASFRHSVISRVGTILWPASKVAGFYRHKARC